MHRLWIHGQAIMCIRDCSQLTKGEIPPGFNQPNFPILKAYIRRLAYKWLAWQGKWAQMRLSLVGCTNIQTHRETQGKPRVQGIDWDHPQDSDHSYLKLWSRKVFQLHCHLVNADRQGQKYKNTSDDPCLQRCAQKKDEPCDAPAWHSGARGNAVTSCKTLASTEDTAATLARAVPPFAVGYFWHQAASSLKTRSENGACGGFHSGWHMRIPKHQSTRQIILRLCIK